jgi:hypothetical protein
MNGDDIVRGAGEGAEQEQRLVIARQQHPCTVAATDDGTWIHAG